jgi:hypothetical protein
MAADRWEMTCRLVGTRASATAKNVVQPHLDDRVVIEIGADRRVAHLGTRSFCIHPTGSIHMAVVCGGARNLCSAFRAGRAAAAHKSPTAAVTSRSAKCRHMPHR